MRLEGNIVVPEAKLSQYLLVSRDRDDKSKFLAQAGFTQQNPDELRQAILNIIATHDAIEDRRDRYGTFYRIEGDLIGPNRTLVVVTIWLQRTLDGAIQFVTLLPKK
ncbi:MAG: DUF6883 domain-containing protein [Cyanobacteria bacterium P01_F01_bin.153]